MKSKPEISFVLPMYNTEIDYLDQCIDSLKKQTLNNIEIIIINDGSTNNCGMYCEEIAKDDNRIKVIHQENQGVSAARNRGVQEASAEWIVFVDPDDWIDIELSEKIYPYISDNKLDILFFTFSMHIGSEVIPQLYNRSEYFVFSPEEHDLLQLSIMNSYKGYSPLVIGSVWGKVFNRSFLMEKNLLFDTNLPKSQDLIFCLYAIEHANNIAYINEPLYHYRMHESSVTKKYNPNIFTYANRLINEVSTFINKYHYNDEKFVQGYHNMVATVFIENMILDFLHHKNPENYLARRRKFNEVINTNPYKEAFKKVELEQFNVKQKIEIMLLKSKLFLPLLLYFNRRFGK